MTRSWPLLVLLCSLAACAPKERSCIRTADCSITEECIGGLCRYRAPDGGTGAGQGGGAGGGNGGGGGGTVSGCDPQRSDNAARDTDCDGLSDADEYSVTVSGRKTDPCNADTDGDGLADGLELGKGQSPVSTCAFTADADPASKTDPTVADTDGDGLSDGEEDRNKNGKVEAESDPLRKDTDCDALSDGEEVKGARGCATDPTRLDTDNDGLPDGVEAQAVAPGPDNGFCRYQPSAFDADPSTKTDACKPDSDGDGVLDGAEDSNQNGKVDPNELDPGNPQDVTGPVAQACATNQLRPVVFHSSVIPDVQVALSPSFAQVSRLKDAQGNERGFIFFDPTNKVAGLAFSQTPTGATATAEETLGRSKLESLGNVTAPITQTFTTWDGFASSVRATYDHAGSADLVARANDIAKAFLGQNIGGLLAGPAGIAGPFKLQAEYVRRSDRRTVVVFALANQASYAGSQLFRVDDVAGGSALAQFGDFARAQCEVYQTEGTATVDFLWVVDNSGSMQSYQQAVGNAGTTFGQKLASAGLDWRAGAVSTGYYAFPQATDYRAFTAQVSTMQGWFDSQSPDWFGVNGTGWEQSLQSAQDYIGGVLLPKTADAAVNKVRQKAALHVILLGDADDQASSTIQAVSAFFNSYDGAGSKAVVHGIVCPEGQGCGETQANPRRNLAVIGATGGVQGDINVAQSGSPQLANTLDAILGAAIAGTGHRLQRPPISVTLKVAIEAGATAGACNTADVPRDRANGFDFDAATRRLVLYGNCRPTGAGKKIAVSYKFWNDGSPDPSGDPCEGKCSGPFTCDGQTRQCACPANCGGCAGDLVCDPKACACVPGVN